MAQTKLKGGQIDYENLKVYMPDYANKESTNRWNGVSTWTSDRRGFVYFYLYSYNTTTIQSPIVTINGVEISHAVMEAAHTNGARVTANSGVLPVNTGDIISYSSANTINARNLHFIPGRWV